MSRVFVDDFNDPDGEPLAGFVLWVRGSRFHSPLVLLSREKARFAVFPNAVVSWLEPLDTLLQRHIEINESWGKKKAAK